MLKTRNISLFNYSTHIKLGGRCTLRAGIFVLHPPMPTVIDPVHQSITSPVFSVWMTSCMNLPTT